MKYLSGKKLQIAGKVFNNLTVIKECPDRSNDRKVKWMCRCTCGKTTTVTGVSLVSGHTKSCGCTSKQIKDLTGKKYGHLTVTKLHTKKANEGARLWECLCVCGNKTIVRTSALNNGSSKSCGCKRTEANRGANHHRIKNMIEEYGDHISQSSPFYKMASRTIFRAKEYGIRVGFKSRAEFAIYLKTITPTKCPVFGKKMVVGDGQPHKWSPSVDKIIPSKGYVRGNIQIISKLANSMKYDASKRELKQFAQWALRETA